MKKTALISALVFFIVASLVSGSLAVYQATVDSGQKFFEAAKFVIKSDVSELYTRDLTMAPGDTQSVTFTIKNYDDKNNVTETDMKLNIDVELTTDIAPMTMKLYSVDPVSKARTEISTPQNISVNGTKTTISYDSQTALFEANKSESKEYVLEFSWPSGENDAQYQGKLASFTIKATGTQVADTSENGVK